MSEEYKNWFGRLHHLHYIYVILILMMIIVAFVAYYHCDDRDLVAQVGFAASISSIILSVLAIIVTVVSNGSMDKLSHGIYGLKDVPSDVKRSTDDAIKKITDTTDALNEASEDNRKGIADMHSKFEALFKELEQHVEDKLQNNAEQVRQMVTDMQASTVSLAQSMKSSDIKEKNKYELNDDVIEHMMIRNSPAGLTLLYAIDKYLEKGISNMFDLKKMDEFYSNNTYSQYFYGYIVLLSALKICDINQSSTDNLKIVFLNFDSKVREKFKENMGKSNLDHNVLAKIDHYLDELKYMDDNSGDGEKE